MWLIYFNTKIYFSSEFYIALLFIYEFYIYISNVNKAR